MLEDTDAPVLLTQEQLVEGLPTSTGEVVRLDASWPVIAEAEAILTSRATADNLAYVIYTSGSTGQPKGGDDRTSCASQLRCGSHAAYEMTASDRVLQRLVELRRRASKIFPTLTCGGTGVAQ